MSTVASGLPHVSDPGFCYIIFSYKCVGETYTN